MKMNKIEKSNYIRTRYIEVGQLQRLAQEAIDQVKYEDMLDIELMQQIAVSDLVDSSVHASYNNDSIW